MKITIGNIFENYQEDNLDILIIFGHQGLDFTNATFGQIFDERTLVFGDNFCEIIKNENIKENIELFTVKDLNGNIEGFTRENLNNVFNDFLNRVQGSKKIGILIPTPLNYSKELRPIQTYNVILDVKELFSDRLAHGEVVLYTLTW